MHWTAIRRAFGVALLALSALASAALFALPFLDVTLAEGAAAAVALVVAAEAGFLLGVALLGREAWDRLKAAVARLRAKGTD
jgi:hypothetical protein